MLPSVSPTSQNRRKELGLVITGQVSYWLWPNREQILFLVPESKKYLFLIDNDPERRDYSKHWNIIQLSTLWPEKESREWLISITSPIHLRGERWIITRGAPDQIQEQGRRNIWVSFTEDQCPQCEKLFTEKGSLNKYIDSILRKIKYPCDKCRKKFTELGSMKKHIQSVHERVMFPCDKFYYQATEKVLLKKHVVCPWRFQVSFWSLWKTIYRTS